MPGLHHAMAGAFGRDRQTVKLARQTDREIADVDHLLHFAQAFLKDLAGFQRDQLAELFLVGAQFLSEQADQLAAARRGHIAPLFERFHAGRDLLFDRGGVVIGNARQLRAVDGRTGDHVAGRFDAEMGENVVHGAGPYFPPPFTGEVLSVARRRGRPLHRFAVPLPRKRGRKNHT